MMEVYLNLSDTSREARTEMILFLEHLREQGMEYRANANQRIVIIEGKEIHFIIGEEYERWCRGKTYYFNGRKYKSGYLLEDNTVKIPT
jgi:hypothetical protein